MRLCQSAKLVLDPEGCVVCGGRGYETLWVGKGARKGVIFTVGTL